MLGTTLARARRALAAAGRTYQAARCRTWRRYSHLVVVADGAEWVLAWEARALAATARRAGIPVVLTRHPSWVRSQAVFYTDQYVLTNPALLTGANRIGIAYLHGRSVDTDAALRQCYDTFRSHHTRIDRVQVSHTAMQRFVLDAGVAPEKVFLIPIGVDLSYFPVRTPESRRRARAAYGIPDSAVVVGSFQKDGVGWGHSAAPKLIKGPDVFLRVIDQLRHRVPELFVLLSGPARGYVKQGLAQLGVPFGHHYPEDYRQVGSLYHAIDAYLVTSREEGGPKAVLEALACGVPLVTTRVGQATDLVQHGVNGWMVEVEDVDGLAHWTAHALGGGYTGAVERSGRAVAEAQSYEAQTPLWREFFRGFVDGASHR